MKNMLLVFIMVFMLSFAAAESNLDVKPEMPELEPLPAVEVLAQMNDEEYFENYFRPVLRFIAVSDTHVQDGETVADSRVAEMCKAVYAYADAHDTYKALDGVIIAGDFTDRGTEKSMQKVYDIIAENTRDYTVTQLVLGNHEFYDGRGKTVSRFLNTFGYEDDDWHIMIEGYHFIGVSPNNGGDGYSEEKQKWLDAELAIAAADDPTGTKPIFVFQHHPVSGTVLGSSDWGVTDLRGVMNKYPQVVDFAGHSHYPINDPRSVWQGRFTALNTGTLSYYECDLVNVKSSQVFARGTDGDWVGDTTGKDAAQFYIVEVDANNAIKMQIFDLLSNSFMTEPLYFRSVGDTSKFTYTSNRKYFASAPEFDAADAVTVKNVEYNLVSVEFPQAHGGEQINHYRVELYQADQKVQTEYRTACAYYIPTPETLTASFKKLIPSTEYMMKIYAISCWGLESEPLTVQFATPEAPEGVTVIIPGPKYEGDMPAADIFAVEFQQEHQAIDHVSGKTLVAKGNPKTEYDGELDKMIAIFDGASDFQYNDFANFYEDLAAASNITMEVYMRADDVSGGWVNPFSNQEYGGVGIELDSKSLNLQIYVSLNGAYQSVGSKIELGEWVHFVGTYDGEMLRCYVNGELKKEKKTSGTITMPETAQYLSVGADSGYENASQAHFIGAIADAKVYSWAMSAEDVAKLYQAYAD